MARRLLARAAPCLLARRGRGPLRRSLPVLLLFALIVGQALLLLAHRRGGLRAPSPRLSMFRRGRGAATAGGAGDGLSAADLATLTASLQDFPSPASRFASVPTWVGQRTSEPRDAEVPCLWSSALARNMYLIPGGWEQMSAASGATAKCALPSGGQLPAPAAAPPAVTVIVTAQGQESITMECAIALFRFARELPSAEFHLIDDGSEPPLTDLPRFLGQLRTAFGTTARFDRNDVPVGFIDVVSKAARAARGDLLLLLNNDIIIQKGSLRALLATFTTHPNVGAVAPKLLQPSGAIQDAGDLVFSDAARWPYGRGEPSHLDAYNYVRETDALSGSCLLVKKDVFVRLGLFDGRFRPAYYDDTDTSFAVRRAGLRVLYQPFSEVIHYASGAYARRNRAEADSARLMSGPQALNRRKFALKWREALSCHLPAGVVAAPADAHAAASRLATLRVLVVDWIVPEPDRDSGSIRMLYLLHMLLQLRCHVTFVPADGGGRRDPRYKAALQYLGVHVASLASLADMRDPFVAAESDGDAPGGGGAGGGGCRYDVVVISRRDSFKASLQAVQEGCPDAPIVFDTVDLHFMREARRARFKRDHAGDGALLEAIFGADGASPNPAVHATNVEVELQFASTSAVTIVVSDAERDEILRQLPDARVRVVSNIHQLEPTHEPFAHRAGAVFVGNWNHLPNRDAVLFFAQEILPLVHPRVGPDFRFHVVGANNLPPVIAALNGSRMSGVERIVVHGFVADLQAFYAGMRLSVVPLRWGAGVKGKVNSAMKYGVPVVCTSVATEGMRLRHGSDALIADDPSAFADHVVKAYHDAALWHRLRAGGFENVQAHFSLASAAQGLAHVFDDVLAADDDGALEERLRLNLKRLAQGGGGGEEAPGGACGPLPAVPALDESEWGGW